MKIFSIEELPYVKKYKLLANDIKLNIIYILLGIFTLGIFFLLAFWFESIYYKFFREE